MLIEHPSHAAFYLFRVGIHTITADSGHLTPILIFTFQRQFCIDPETKVREGFFRTAAERLFVFRRVNFSQPYPHLLVIYHHRQSVAISHIDYLTMDNVVRRASIDRAGEDRNDKYCKSSNAMGMRAPHIVFNVVGFAYVAQTAPVRLLLGYCEGQAAVDYIAAVQIPFLYIFAARLVSLKKDGLAG
jgi:hypothetical protein